MKVFCFYVQYKPNGRFGKAIMIWTSHIYTNVHLAQVIWLQLIFVELVLLGILWHILGVLLSEGFPFLQEYIWEGNVYGIYHLLGDILGLSPFWLDRRVIDFNNKVFFHNCPHFSTALQLIYVCGDTGLSCFMFFMMISCFIAWLILLSFDINPWFLYRFHMHSLISWILRPSCREGMASMELLMMVLILLLMLWIAIILDKFSHNTVFLGMYFHL